MKSVRRVPEDDFVRVTIGERIAAAFYRLDIEFHTRICEPSTSTGVHCFLSRRQDESFDGMKRREVLGFATMFEPSFARAFLPGWDEPRVKTTFSVSIRHFADITVLTNTAPIIVTEEVSKDSEGSEEFSGSPPRGSRKMVITKHETTPQMPMYLLAFSTGPILLLINL